MKLKTTILNSINKILLIGLLFILVGQLYITFIKYEDKFESPLKVIKESYGNDYITQYGKRYEEIKKMFPKSTNLTYIGENNEDFASGALNYILTQYYLSPNLILRNQVGRDTIIYNLYNSKQITPSTNFHLKNGWHIVTDFNNGLIILAK